MNWQQYSSNPTMKVTSCTSSIKVILNWSMQHIFPFQCGWNIRYLRGKWFPEVFVKSFVHLCVFKLVSLSQSSGEVHHGFNWHSSLYSFIASMYLGIGLLYQSNPELIRVRTFSIAVGAFALGQPVQGEVIVRVFKLDLRKYTCHQYRLWPNCHSAIH